MKQAAPNGRDYYPDPGRMEKATAQHMRRLKAVQQVMDELELEIQGIEDLRVSR